MLCRTLYCFTISINCTVVRDRYESFDVILQRHVLRALPGPCDGSNGDGVLRSALPIDEHPLVQQYPKLGRDTMADPVTYGVRSVDLTLVAYLQDQVFETLLVDGTAGPLHMC